MKNWERHQIRIANAKTARQFIVWLLRCNKKLETDCYSHRLKGECDSSKPKICEECIMKWLNAEVEEENK